MIQTILDNNIHFENKIKFAKKVIGYFEPLSEKQTKNIFLDILRAVNHLHTLGIAHRDLKMENICMTSDNHPKLIDFNLSCQYTSKITQNQFCGSLNYCAPELFFT